MQEILNAQSSDDGAVYLWDLLDPRLQYAALIAVQDTTNWNITEQLLSNQTTMEWATLPADV